MGSILKRPLKEISLSMEDVSDHTEIDETLKEWHGTLTPNDIFDLQTRNMTWRDARTEIVKNVLVEFEGTCARPDLWRRAVGLPV